MEFIFEQLENEPEWSLKISEKQIEFTSLKPGFESFLIVHVELKRAMDANVKIYCLVTETGTMNIQISQNRCTNTMSGEDFPYSVEIEITVKNKSEKLKGSGNYITDAGLHDIWILERLNGKLVLPADFMKEVPSLEINSSTNNFMGFAGCNRMNGMLFFERGLLRFTNIITTRMACPLGNKEAKFLKALKNTASYQVKNGRLQLSNPSGEKLVFRKVD